MLDQQSGGLPARHPAHVPSWAQEVLQTPSCLYDRALSCSAVPAWCAAHWPEEQGTGRTAGQQTSDSNPAPREQGWKSGGYLGWGPAVVTRPCVFSLAGAWGRASHLSLCKAGFWLPCSRAADLLGGMAGGWRGAWFSVIPLGVHIPPQGVRAGKSLKTRCPASWCVLRMGQLAQVRRGTLYSEETSPGSMEVALRPSDPREGRGGGRGASDCLRFSQGLAHPG